MSDKKITELPLASAVNASDVSVLVNNGTDYQFAFSSLLQLIGSSLTVGANITFGTTLPQNTVGKNGDVFINTETAVFAQKISGAWTVVYTLPASGGTTDGTVLYGIGVPSSLTGNNNDTYINTGSGIFYKKNAGTWNQVFSMQTGPAGAPGAPGSNGTNGTNGFSILNGTTNPSNLSTGVNGDFYINTTTYILFGPKTADNWGAGTSLIGNGVPIGGTSGQIMAKSSDNSFDIEWTDKFSGLSDNNITDALGYTPEDVSNKGTPNGYAGLDESGKVPSSQLPSYVDDVIEVVNFAALPVTGETGKIYVTIDTNFEYRWSGSTYIRLISSPGSTDALPEGTSNLYFTNTRARSASSATTPIFYDTTTGVISSQAATASQNGYLSSNDWTVFNNKQAALSGTGHVKSTAGVISYDSNTYNSGAGTAGYIAKYSAANTQAISGLYETAGLLGLGHTSPLTFFHINSGSTVPLRISTTADEVAQYITSNAFGGFRVATTGASSVPYIAFNTGATANGSSMGTQRAYFAYNLNGANTASLGYGSGTSAITYITSGTGVGNVGFGTNTPAYKVDVNGVVNATSFRGAGTDLTGTAAGLNIGGNAATVTNGVYTTGNYSNPSWITALAWSKISSAPTTIAGYGITDFNSLGDARWAINANLVHKSGAENISGHKTFVYNEDVPGDTTPGITMKDVPITFYRGASFGPGNMWLNFTIDDIDAFAQAGQQGYSGSFLAGDFGIRSTNNGIFLNVPGPNDNYEDGQGLYVARNGNVSIGWSYDDAQRTAPIYTLDVKGSIRSNYLKVDGDGIYMYKPASFSSYNSITFEIDDINAFGQMGQFAYSADNGDIGGMFIISGAGKGISLYTNNDGFGLTGVYIAPNGYVGINLGAGDHATDPLAALEVNGNIVATNSLNPSIKLTNTTSGRSWEAIINSEVLQLTGGTTPGMIQEWYRDTGSSQVGANIFGDLFAWTLTTYQPGSASAQGPKYKWGSVIDGSSYTFHNECIEVEINGVTKYIPLFANWE